MDIKITGLDGIQKKLDRLAKAASPDEQAKMLRSFRCREHGKAPTNVRVSGSEVKAEFCCEPARAEALAKIKESISRATR